MVSSDILEYGRPGEVLNNYTSGYDIEVNPEVKKFVLQKSWAEIEIQAYIMG